MATAPAAPIFTGSLGAAPTEYRIGPSDVLEVTVFGVPELSKVAQVSATGQISLPLIGALAAGGRTVSALEEEIAGKLGATYLQSPQVSVFVKEAAGQRVTVGGAVRQPGVFPIIGEATLLQMVALAQGLDPLADARNILVFRPAGTQRTVARFDLAAISTGKAEDPAIRGGDIVIVDQSGAKAAWRNITQALPVISIFSPLM
ncbi:MAG TPA: polysaccharide biosynthesis/export family protein [Afifellaceae bacterium]|nr:polysaccharide biosynthesis/export family protein [Afifellaceae bacterium]